MSEENKLIIFNIRGKILKLKQKDIPVEDWFIYNLVNDISNLKDLKKNSVEFYNNKIESTERTIDILKDRISEFMLSSDNSKIPTQAGTAYFTKRTKEVYPDDETLIEFSIL